MRAALITILLVAACGKGEPAKREPAPAGHDPWADPPPPRAPEPVRVRKLSMDGTIEGATPALLATPLSGYRDSKVGDWRAYRHITTGKLGDFHATAIAEVTAVTPTTVTVEFRGRLDETGEQRSDGADEFPRAFTIEHEIHRQHGDWAASRVEVTDEAHTEGDRSFPCKKLSFASADPMLPRKETTVEVWLSPDVPAGGEVAVHEVQKMPAMTLTSTSDLIGFGDASHTMWGTKPAGL